MNWHKLRDTLTAKGILLFSASDLIRIFGISNVASNFLLFRYAKNGSLVRLKRGLYAFPDLLPSDFVIANSLYRPSYISREFALSYHSVIPENVYELTSVTSGTTRRFQTGGKVYSYRHIQPSAFVNYVLAEQQGVKFQIADPEKAFVDTVYFRLVDKLSPLSRFNKEKINKAKAIECAELFDSSALMSEVQKLLA